MENGMLVYCELVSATLFQKLHDMIKLDLANFRSDSEFTHTQRFNDSPSVKKVSITGLSSIVLLNNIVV